MSEQYTPTTGLVRARYCDSTVRGEQDDAHALGVPREVHEKNHAEFDRWLAKPDAALAAADAVCCAHPKCPGGSLCCCQSDAVVTEEMIAETILKALVFTSENSEAWADGLARDIAALFRGGAK